MKKWTNFAKITVPSDVTTKKTDTRRPKRWNVKVKKSAYLLRSFMSDLDSENVRATKFKMNTLAKLFYNHQ